MSGSDKPALSSRLLGLKFMQRGREKEQKAAAEAAAQERNAEAHWVVEGARTRCVVLAEGDPAPCEGSAPSGRMSFGGFSPSAEQAQQEDEAAAALAEAEAANPDGKAVSDAAMAASLQRQQGGKSKKQRHGGGDGGGRHSGGKRRGRDDGGEDRQEKKKKSTGRYF